MLYVNYTAITLFKKKYFRFQFSSVQLLSRVQLWDPMNHSTPGFSVHHQLLELAQTYVYRVSDAIQPSISSSIIPPIFWPPDAKNCLIGKDPDSGKDRWQEEKGTEDEIIGWHH